LIQNSISSSRLWKNGPYVWATLVYHFFPSSLVTLKTTILHKMKSASLADHNHDLKSYCAALMDMNAIVNTSAHTEELVTAFLAQMNTHPSDIIRNHFNQISIKFFMNPDEEQSLTHLLDAADHLHKVTTSPALPFTASVATSSKLEQDITALAGILEANMRSLKKVVAHVSQLNNKVHQGFQLVKKSGSPGSHSKTRGNKQMPPWKYKAPMDPKEVKEFASHTWYWCGTCGHWSTTHSANGFSHNDKAIPNMKESLPTRRKCLHSQPPVHSLPKKRKRVAMPLMASSRSKQNLPSSLRAASSTSSRVLLGISRFFLFSLPLSAFFCIVLGVVSTKNFHSHISL
jgi:hypothetical protein